MNNMILGRYIPGNSIIHQLDPRGKLLSMFYSYFFCFGQIISRQMFFSLVLFCFNVSNEDFG